MRGTMRKSSSPANVGVPKKQHTERQKRTAALLGQHTKELNKRRRMLIVDVPLETGPVETAEQLSGVGWARTYSDDLKQSTFRRLIERLEAARLHYRVFDLSRVEPSWRTKVEDVLRAPQDRASEIAAQVWRIMEVAILSAWARKIIPGPVTELTLERQAVKTEKLAAWRDRAGDDNAAHLQAQADAIRQQTPEELYRQFAHAIRKDYSPMAKIQVSQQEVIQKIIDNGGTMTEEALKGLGVNDRALKVLLSKKLIEQPSVGLYRVIEAAVAAPPTEEQKAEAEKVAKPAKAPKAPKEKKPKVEKPKINPSELCLCGCSEKVPATSRFRPGHDAKLHSLVLKTIKAQGDKKALSELAEKSPARLFPKGDQGKLQREYLDKAPWMDAATRKGIAL